MEKITLENLDLVVFDKNNEKHISFLKSLIKDKTILARFQGIAQNLLHNFGDEFFNRSFFLATKGSETLIGFINIGIYNNHEKSVYLRYAIDNNERGKGYGKLLLRDVTNFIFNNFAEVETIRLKIVSDNKASIGTASSCGYKWYKDDYYIFCNPNLTEEYKPSFR